MYFFFPQLVVIFICCYWYLRTKRIKYFSSLLILDVYNQIPSEAAYLYDAVHLYSRALISALKNGTNPRNGTAIIEFMKETHYKSAMGWVWTIVPLIGSHFKKYFKTNVTLKNVFSQKYFVDRKMYIFWTDEFYVGTLVIIDY